ncbi:MAG: chromosomal replication initiator protein DnaA [Candidatus Liptonbacteria bacterium]|nr:chromosomal replication initiator protein DnaA [Candidatus Liptonbacteria bacterium]
MEKNLDTLWHSILSEMETQLSRANFATWLKNSRLADEKEGTLFVVLPNNFAKEWVENKYQKNLLGAARNFDDSVKKLEFLVSGQKLDLAPRKVSATDFNKFENKINLEFQTDPETNLNPRYTLNSFVVGSSNELAFSAASAIVQNVGSKYNPFFVYGGVGLGKTHLIQAIGNEIKAHYRGKIKSKYVSSEKFTSDVVWAIRNRRMEDIKKKYRDVDVLIIDDIQFIGGKEKTEEEFFHTFNTLYENNKQIIISSDRPPQSIPTLEERLRSRFEGGLIADIVYPEYEMRTAIIKGKLQESNRELGDAAIDLIARKVKKNVRELEGILNKILFHQEMRGAPVTEKVVEEIIEKAAQNFTRRVNDSQIIKSVAEFYNVSVGDLEGHVRKKEIVEPRQIAMYLLRDMLDMSYPYIGEKLGKDHTTAIHAVKKIDQEIERNSLLNQKIISIKELIFRA